MSKLIAIVGEALYLAGVGPRVAYPMFDEDFKVLSSEELEGIINITLQLADDSSQQFNLRFESNPIKLLSMTQKGEFGTNLNITFANQKYNKPVDSELFKFTPELEKIPE